MHKLRDSGPYEHRKTLIKRHIFIVLSQTFFSRWLSTGECYRHVMRGVILFVPQPGRIVLHVPRPESPRTSSHLHTALQRLIKSSAHLSKSCLTDIETTNIQKNANPGACRRSSDAVCWTLGGNHRQCLAARSRKKRVQAPFPFYDKSFDSSKLLDKGIISALEKSDTTSGL